MRDSRDAGAPSEHTGSGSGAGSDHVEYATTTPVTASMAAAERRPMNAAVVAALTAEAVAER